MNHAFCKSIIWLLIAELAIIAGAGEALHLIPGCGHGVELGNRILLFGIDLPKSHYIPAGDMPRVVQATDLEIPICDEDLCAICSLIAKQGTPSSSILFVVVMPLLHEATWIVPDEVTTAVIRLFRSRAPPLV